MKEKQITCLRCGGNTVEDTSIAYKIEGNTLVKYAYGYCVKCGQSHRWEEEFALVKIKNLRKGEE